MSSSIIDLPDIRKNFYIEDPSVANMHPEEIAHIRYIFCNRNGLISDHIHFMEIALVLDAIYFAQWKKESILQLSHKLIKTSSYRMCEDVSFSKMYTVLFEKMFNLPIFFFQIFHFSVVNLKTSLSWYFSVQET